MRMLPASLFLASLVVLTPAAAAEPYADEPQARLSWSMSFGPQSASSGYSLALDYRSLNHEFAPVKLIEMNVAGVATQARLLGLPFYDTRYTLGQSEGGDLAVTSMAFDWRWVWWAVSGVAVTAVIVDKSSSDDDPAPAGTGTGA